MVQIFIGSLFLSMIHALIPNHWLPIIAIGKTGKWTQNQTFWATVITGVSHTLSTIAIGILVGFIGYKLASGYSVISELLAPLILIALGVIYLAIDLKSHNHHHHELMITGTEPGQNNRGRVAIITSLSFAMFLTPCIEIEAYYFQAGTFGWTGIFIVSAVYLVTTLGSMLTLVYLGTKGINTFNSHFLEHHEKGVTGSVLVVLGMLSLLVH